MDVSQKDAPPLLRFSTSPLLISISPLKFCGSGPKGSDRHVSGLRLEFNLRIIIRNIFKILKINIILNGRSQIDIWALI